MGKKHKHEEHVNHERWLVSYADFITLLFAFFVIMYAISEVDKNKMKKFKNSVQFAFSHSGSGGTMTQGKDADTLRPKLVGTSWPKGRRDSDPGPFENLTAIVEYLEGSMVKYFVKNERASVEIADDGKGIVLRLPAERLFVRQSATLRPDRMEFLEDFGRMILKFNLSFEVRAELRVPTGGDVAAEGDLALRRNSALIRSTRRTSADVRARLLATLDLVEDDVDTSNAEKSRMLFDFRVYPR
jgi:chemotaxis protein MotB